MLETVFMCVKLVELKPDLTTTVHFAIQLSYYTMSYFNWPIFGLWREVNVSL